MKVYEVKIEKCRGKYETVKFFSSKKKAIDYILFQGDCNVIREEGDIPYDDKWYHKEDMNAKEWNRLVNKAKVYYHIFRGNIYFINKIKVE